jgi:predicted RNase H-like HicB family nuclease
MEQRKDRRMKIKVVIHPAEEGGFWAEVPALKGCYSEGDTIEDALANIREAATGWLEVAAEQTQATAPAQLAEMKPSVPTIAKIDRALKRAEREGN